MRTAPCATGKSRKPYPVFGLARFAYLSAESTGFEPTGNRRFDELPRLEFHLDVQNRSVALDLAPAEPGVETLEAEDDTVAQLVVDLEIDPPP